MLQKLLNRKLHGSTLPEVLVALVLLTFCTSLAVMIYLNVQESTQPFARIKAQELSEKHMQKALTSAVLSDYEEEEAGLRVRCRIGELNQYGNRYIKITVFNSSDKVISELQVLK